MELEQTLPKLFRKSAEKYPEFSAQLFRTKDGTYAETNYHDCYQKALDFSGALLKFGVKRGDKIGLIADNRRYGNRRIHNLLLFFLCHSDLNQT
mgnify:CR=1 FL=1